jgi:hypothetical protein
LFGVWGLVFFDVCCLLFVVVQKVQFVQQVQNVTAEWDETF